MSTLASIRPDSWNFPLLVHVLGAMILVGTTITFVVAELAAAGTPQPERMRRFAFRTLLFVGLPALIIMRVGGEWLYSKEFDGASGDDPSWIGIGYGVSDLGGLLFLISLVLAGFASRKARSGLGRAAGVTAAICLVGWVVAVWAMGAKPS